MKQGLAHVTVDWGIIGEEHKVYYFKIALRQSIKSKPGKIILHLSIASRLDLKKVNDLDGNFSKLLDASV